MKILIIEDDAQIVSFISKSLNSKSWLVESTNNGQEGLKMAQSGSYALLILDLNLPGLSGREIITKLRKQKINLAIIVLSVRSSLDDKKELFKLGADDYLTKPFLIDELIARIEALLRRPLQIRSGNIRLGTLVYNTTCRIFTRANKELYLTKKEHNLLLFLLRKKNSIVSKGEILEYVWNYNSNPNSNSIETHIAILRKKINIDNQINLIHTFPGRGYKLSLKKLS